MNARHVAVHLSLDLGADHRVVGCRVREAVSEITHAVVEIAAAHDLDFAAVRAAEATLELAVGDASRRFSLVATGVRFVGLEGGALRYEVDLHARPFLLGHTRDHRKFRDLPALEIVARVLLDHQIPFVFRAEPTASRPYTAQYAESHLDFVSRLLEDEGLHYAFEPDGMMVISDRSSAAPPVDGPSSRFELLDAAGALDRDERGVLSIERVARIAPGRVTLRDFDWKKPRADLTASCVTDVDEALEIYDYPGGYRDQPAGARRARLRLEAERALASRVLGTADALSFAAGRRFTLGDAAGAAFAGDWFLVSVEHRAADLGAADASYHHRFTAIPLAVPFRPGRRTPRPTVAGVHTAMVRGPAGQEIHTDRFGRAKVQFHWDREAKGSDEDSRWMRVMQETSTSMALARVGWEIGVSYIDGDPERPVGVSRHINGAMPPAYGQPSNKNAMTMMTPSSPATGGYSELKLDDSAERMRFDLRAEKDMSTAVGHDKGETIGNDERRFVGNDTTERVGGDQSIEVGRDATETVDGDRHFAIDGNRKKTVAHSETVEVGDTIAVSTNHDETERVGLARITIAGGLTLPDILGRAKRAISGLIPEPGAAIHAIVGGVEAGAESGAVAGAKSGFEAAGGSLGGGPGAGALGALSNLGGGLGGEALGALGNVGKGALGSLLGGGVGAQAAGALLGGGLGADPLGALGGAAQGALGGALHGALGSLTQGLKNLIPNPKAIASQITGGLSDGITLDKIEAQVLTGSIARSAEDKITRTIGGAFISVAAKDIQTTSGKIHLETVGGLKLSQVKGAFSESTEGVLTITAGGSILRSSGVDITIASGTSTVRSGATVTLEAKGEIYLTAPEVEITGLAGLDLAGGGADVNLGPASLGLSGDVQIKGNSSVWFVSSTLDYQER
jgi:type VI secretion system secreted protein VgrG